MLLTFVVLYIVVSIAIGLFAGRNVHDTRDYVVAGRTLPFYVVTATVFATWFGSETVLGIPATFFEGRPGRHRRGSVRLVDVPHPGGAVLRREALPDGPAHHRRLLPQALQPARWRCSPAWRSSARTSAGCRRRSWRSAWSSPSSPAARSRCSWASSSAPRWCCSTRCGAACVSVACTDFVQMMVIVIGMLYIAWVIGDMAGGVGMVIDARAQCRKAQVLSRAHDARRAVVHRRGRDHDARLDSAAGRVPARHVGEDAEHRRMGLGDRAACSTSCSPSCRSSSATRRS